LGGIGRDILQPELMRVLDAGTRGAGGEIQLTDAIAKLIGKQPVNALKVDAVRHDCGDKVGFVLANLALALERPDMAPQVREYLSKL
jgi:UTP--glucose-1-phosphate uridylyltransferase